MKSAIPQALPATPLAAVSEALSLARSVVAAIALALVTFVCASAAHGEQSATLVTDKDDYAPGETVYFLGTGFWAGEAVIITLAVHTIEGSILDYAVGGIYADSEGSFAAEWLVPQEAAGTWIEASAIGDQSALVATATFTDNHFTLELAAISASGNDVTVTVSIGGGTPLPGNVTAIVQTPSLPDLSLPLVRTTGDGVDPSIWSGTFEGICETTYTLRHVHVSHVSPHPGGGAQFNNVAAGSEFVTTATTGACDEPPECPQNNPPIINASDYILPEVCAVWNGNALTVTIPIEPEDFEPETNDPDGDPVTVSLDVTEVTLTGLGEVEVCVTLTATDDPSGRNEDDCEPLEALSTSITVKVRANLTFNFDGFGAPLNNNVVRKVKNGSTVPVKFRLFDCNGTEICELPEGYTNEIWVGLQSEYCSEGGVEVDDAGSSNDNTPYFRYSGTCGENGNWIYNLSTKTGYSVGKTYKVTAILADGTTHDVLIGINR